MGKRSKEGLQSVKVNPYKRKVDFFREMSKPKKKKKTFST